MSPLKILCVVGRSGVGKTTVLEKWLPYLGSQGYRVGVVKHSHHPLPEDLPGKDSARLTPAYWSMFTTPSGLQLRGQVEWTAVLEWLASQVDLVLVEGGKSTPFPKIEVVRSQPPLLAADQLLATIGDAVAGLPQLALDDPPGWTRFWLDARTGG